MSSKRVDVSHEYTYPTSPDARGSTRVNHKRRPYYLGPHESPLSYIMFGLWKHGLQEAGEPPSTKEIRALAEEILASGGVTSGLHRSTKIRVSRVAYALVGLILVVVLGGVFFSSGSVPRVDDVVLSDSEAEVVRAIRKRNDVAMQAEIGPYDSVAGLTEQLIAEGISNGAKHVAGSNF